MENRITCSVCERNRAEYKTNGEYLLESFPYLCKDCFKALVSSRKESKTFYDKIGIHKEQATAEVLV